MEKATMLGMEQWVSRSRHFEVQSIGLTFAQIGNVTSKWDEAKQRVWRLTRM